MHAKNTLEIAARKSNALPALITLKKRFFQIENAKAMDTTSTAIFLRASSKVCN
jgi:hypothetical protein